MGNTLISFATRLAANSNPATGASSSPKLWPPIRASVSPGCSPALKVAATARKARSPAA